MTRRIMLSLVTAAIIGPALAVPAHAAFPGRNGPISFAHEDAAGSLQIATVGSGGGRPRPLTDNPANVGSLASAISPDGRRIAFDRHDPVTAEVWVMDLDGSHKRDLTGALGGASIEPSWSPDGRSIVFAHTNGRGPLQIWAMRASGAGAHPLLTAGVDLQFPHYSPSGRWLSFTRPLASGETAVFVARRDGRRARRVTPPSLDALTDSWAPSGRWLAFASNPPAAPSSLYRVRPDGTELSAITRPGGNGYNDAWPAWSPDGRFIAFMRQRCPNGPSSCDSPQIWRIRPDGRDAARLTRDDPGVNVFPDWGPRPAPTPRS